MGQSNDGRANKARACLDLADEEMRAQAPRYESVVIVLRATRLLLRELPSDHPERDGLLDRLIDLKHRWLAACQARSERREGYARRFAAGS